MSIYQVKHVVKGYTVSGPEAANRHYSWYTLLCVLAEAINHNIYVYGYRPIRLKMLGEMFK